MAQRFRGKSSVFASRTGKQQKRNARKMRDVKCALVPLYRDVTRVYEREYVCACVYVGVSPSVSKKVYLKRWMSLRQISASRIFKNATRSSMILGMRS